MSETMTTRNAAEKLGTDPRILRRFLRSKAKGVGAGKRYELQAKALPQLKKDFAAWHKADQAKRSPKPEAPAAPSPTE